LRSSERRQLKQDQFAAKTQETIDWASEHQTALTYTTIIVAVIAALAIGAFYYQQNREQAASALLSQGIDTFSAPIVPAGSAPIAGETTYTSTVERARAASTKFLEVSQKYPHTDAGTLAKYFLGLCSEDMNDNAKAEQYLKDVADSRPKDTAALAKQALAALYHDEGRDENAIALYKELIAKPTNTVSKASAQMDLAALYAPKEPTEAKKLYAEVAADKNNPEEIVSIANQPNAVPAGAAFAFALSLKLQ
jgi:tetratricopeptide (TPR) repeat protein